jgi:hypothetical protein
MTRWLDVSTIRYESGEWCIDRASETADWKGSAESARSATSSRYAERIELELVGDAVRVEILPRLKSGVRDKIGCRTTVAAFSEVLVRLGRAPSVVFLQLAPEIRGRWQIRGLLPLTTLCSAARRTQFRARYSTLVVPADDAEDPDAFADRVRDVVGQRAGAACRPGKLFTSKPDGICQNDAQREFTILEAKRMEFESDGLAQCLLYDVQARSKAVNSGYTVLLVHACSNDDRSDRYEALTRLSEADRDIRVFVARDSVEPELHVT